MTKKRVISFFPLVLTFCIVMSCIPMFSVSAHGDTITTEEVTRRIANYMSVCEGRFWNGGKGEHELKAAVDRGDYLFGTTDSSSGSNNSFGGGVLCNGFAKYLTYVVFGTDVRDKSTGWSEKMFLDTKMGENDEVYPGDYIYYPRFNSKGQKSQHIVIVYKVEGNKVYYAEGNWGPTNIIKCDRYETMDQVRKNVNAEIGGDRGFLLRSPASSGLSSASNIKPPAQDVNQVGIPNLSITEILAPEGHYDSLKRFGLRGIIKTDKGQISSIIGRIYDGDGYVVQEASRKPNSKNHDIKNSINDDLLFGRLSNGNYRYEVTATAVNGSESSSAVLISTNFTIGTVTGGSSAAEPGIVKPPQVQAEPSTLSISGVSAPSGHFDYLKNYGLRGTISSNYNITYVKGTVADASGAIRLNYETAWNSRNYDIKSQGMNDRLAFGKLGDGTYVFTISATDSSGNTQNQSYNFDIGVQVNNTFVQEQPQFTQQLTTQPQQPLGEQKPNITVSGLNMPSSLIQGKTFDLHGTVRTDCGVLTSVQAEVLDQYGSVVLDSTHYPGTSSLDLAYSINIGLPFGILSAGSYKIVLTASAINGSSESYSVLLEQPFIVDPEFVFPDYGQNINAENNVAATQPTQDFVQQPPAPVQSYEQKPVLSISGHNTPGTLNQGDNFGIRGIVSTDCGIITRIIGEISDPIYGTIMLVEPYIDKQHRKTSIDLQYFVNDYLVFGELPAGDYIYIIRATAENGSQETTTNLVYAPFTINAVNNSVNYTSAPINDIQINSLEQNMSNGGSSTADDIPLNPVERNMTVNVGAGSTLRFCSYVSVADAYEIGSIPNGASVYVYGSTRFFYEDRTWAKINYNGVDGWVNVKWLI